MRLKADVRKPKAELGPVVGVQVRKPKAEVRKSKAEVRKPKAEEVWRALVDPS